MSTHALPRVSAPGARRVTAAPAITHWLWLAGGLALGFSIPFLLADVLELNRDLYYGRFFTNGIYDPSAPAGSAPQRAVDYP